MGTDHSFHLMMRLRSGAVSAVAHMLNDMCKDILYYSVAYLTVLSAAWDGYSSAGWFVNNKLKITWTEVILA